MEEITRQVGQSSDDCYRRLTASYWSLTVDSFYVGLVNLTAYQYGGGMRFTNITIPQGATIDAAYLTLRSSEARSEVTVKSRISAEKSDDAPTFADNASAFDARWANRTTARVNWDAIPAWTKDVDYNSPEIKTVIQEIVDRVGWASGQDMVIFWEDFEDRSSHIIGACRAAYSYDGSIEFAPKLYIQYTPPVVGWTGKISGVTNPAKIMGVDVANIHSVKGVTSA